MADYAAARETMVDRQIRTYAVHDRRLLAALRAVPREEFLPSGQRPFAYSDAELPLRPATRGVDDGRFLMAPGPFARLVQLTDIGEEDVVLDVGCATGYSAAVLARLAGSVVALESDEDLSTAAGARLIELGVDNAAVVSGPLDHGYPSEGPYDAILLEGSVEEVPQALLDQLKDGGRLVAVVGHGGSAQAVLHSRSGDDIGRRAAFNTIAPPLPGFTRPQVFAL